MKLIRWVSSEGSKQGIAIGDMLFDASSFGEDYNGHFFERGGLNRLQRFIEVNELPQLEKSTVLSYPVASPSKIICIGLNYADHAKETNAPLPAEPIIFIKSTTALTGPDDDIVIPKNSTKTDWEVELAVVIKKKGYLCSRRKRHGICSRILPAQRYIRKGVSIRTRRHLG